MSSETPHEHTDSEFWPEGIQEKPGVKFVLTFVFLPILLLFIVYAYVKTLKFAYNSLVFYRRFTKKDETGEFEIPTKKVRRGHHGTKGKNANKKDGAVAAEANANNSDQF